jgi:hypothetical protein
LDARHRAERIADAALDRARRMAIHAGEPEAKAPATKRGK